MTIPTGSVDPITIYSIGYPNFYPNNADCKVTVVAEDKTKSIKTLLTNIDIEIRPTCDLDYLKISNSQYYNKICGNPDSMELNSIVPSVVLSFTSNSRITRSGYVAKFSATELLSGYKLETYLPS